MEELSDVKENITADDYQSFVIQNDWKGLRTAIIKASSINPNIEISLPEGGKVTLAWFVAFVDLYNNRMELLDSLMERSLFVNFNARPKNPEKVKQYLQAKMGMNIGDHEHVDIPLIKLMVPFFFDCNYSSIWKQALSKSSTLIDLTEILTAPASHQPLPQIILNNKIITYSEYPLFQFLCYTGNVQLLVMILRKNFQLLKKEEREEDATNFQNSLVNFKQINFEIFSTQIRYLERGIKHLENLFSYTLFSERESQEAIEMSIEFLESLDKVLPEPESEFEPGSSESESELEGWGAFQRIKQIVQIYLAKNIMAINNREKLISEKMEKYTHFIKRLYDQLPNACTEKREIAKFLCELTKDRVIQFIEYIDYLDKNSIPNRTQVENEKIIQETLDTIMILLKDIKKDYNAAYKESRKLLGNVLMKWVSSKESLIEPLSNSIIDFLIKYYPLPPEYSFDPNHAPKDKIISFIQYFLRESDPDSEFNFTSNILSKKRSPAELETAIPNTKKQKTLLETSKTQADLLTQHGTTFHPSNTAVPIANAGTTIDNPNTDNPNTFEEKKTMNLH